MSGPSHHNDFSGHFNSQQAFMGNRFEGPVYFNSNANNSSCLQALRLVDPRTEKERIMDTKDKLLTGSYEWIFEDPNFLQWRHNKSNILWIKGDPGKGKTMLMFALIDYISQRISSLEPTENTKHSWKSKFKLKHEQKIQKANHISYFICQATDDRLNDGVSILRGLIYVLVRQNTRLLEYVEREYKASDGSLFRGPNAFFDLRRILLGMLEDEQLGTVYLLIDALDECNSRLPNILELICIHTPKIKWIVSSRNIPSIEDKLNSLDSRSKLSLEINQEHVSRAVEAYISSKTSELASKHNYNTTLKQNLATILHRKAEGTFLWIALACKAISEVGPWEVEVVLERIPNGLEPLYDLMLNRIEENRSYGSLVKQILKITVLAFRPMHLEELKSSMDLPKNFQAESIRRPVELCGSFLTIRSNIVYFIHQSVKDYLLENQARFMPGEENHHGWLTIRLLEYMSNTLVMDICQLRRPGTLLTETKVDCDRLNSVRYACRYWIQHLAQASDRTRLLGDSGPVHQFLQSKLLHWLEALSLMGEIRQAILMIVQLRDMVNHEKSPSLFDLAHDTYRFILNSSYIIEQAPLQLYSSVLIFNPSKTTVKQQNQKHISNWIIQAPLVEDSWSASLVALEGHSNWVRSVAFSPDGQLLASGSDDQTIRLWDVNTHTTVAKLDDHSGSVMSVAFSPDGQLLASGSYDETIRLWDVNTHTTVAKLDGHSNSVLSVAFSPDGQLLASGSDDQTIRLWDVNTHTTVAKLDGHSGSVMSVAFSPDGQLLASGSYDETIRLWDVNTHTTVAKLDGHSSSVMSVAFSPDGQLLASGSLDQTIRLWDVNTHTTVAKLDDHSNWVWSVAFSPDGQLLASGSYDQTIRLWDVNTHTTVAKLDDHSNWVWSVAFSPDGQLLASGSYDQTIRLWDVNTHTTVAKLDNHSGSVMSVAFSPDGQLLASGSYDHTIRLWDVNTHTTVAQLDDHSDSVMSVAFSPDGQLLASGSYDHTIRLWDVNTHTTVAKLDGHSLVVSAVAFSPDGQLLASGSYDKTIRLWDINTHTTVAKLDGQSKFVNALTFSPDDQIIEYRLGFESKFNHWDIGKIDATNSNKKLTHRPKSANGNSTSSAKDQSHIPVGNQNELEENRELAVMDNWITTGGIPILWLPPDYRPATMASRGNVVAIGTQRGRVFFLKFELSKIPL